MLETRARIRWVTPATTIAPSAAAAMPAALSTHPRLTRTMIRAAGIPLVEGAVSAKEYALKLLRLAAEVEHALLVQYLYLAASVTGEVSSDGIDYRVKLITVAIQEMGHLAAVQNLLLLVGGPEEVYLYRDLERIASTLNPLPFALEKLSQDSLAKYIVVEMPVEVPAHLTLRIDALRKVAEADAGVVPHRVGMIYEILHRLFSDPGGETEHFLAEVAAEIPEIPRLTDQDLHSAEEVDRHAATREEWGVDREDVILETPHTRAQARDLIDHIGRQGEGFPGDADSHFMEFIETLDAFENGLISVIPLPESPSLMAGPGKERIENPYTRLWAEVMNYQYSLLVMAIFHAILIPRGDSAAETLRKGLADAALRGMRRVVKMLNATFISLPMKGPGTEPAGPPYHLEEGIMDSTKPAELIAVQLRLLDRLEEVYRKIEAAAEFAGRPDDSTSLTNLRNWDQRRRQLFDPPQ